MLYFQTHADNNKKSNQAVLNDTLLNNIETNYRAVITNIMQDIFEIDTQKHEKNIAQIVKLMIDKTIDKTWKYENNIFTFTTLDKLQTLQVIKNDRLYCKIDVKFYDNHIINEVTVEKYTNKTKVIQNNFIYCNIYVKHDKDIMDEATCENYNNKTVMTRQWILKYNELGQLFYQDSSVKERSSSHRTVEEQYNDQEYKFIVTDYEDGLLIRTLVLNKDHKRVTDTIYIYKDKKLISTVIYYYEDREGDRVPVKKVVLDENGKILEEKNIAPNELAKTPE